MRENTEGLYAGLEHRIAPGIVTSLKVMTETACTRISRFAFQLAERQGRRSVTAIHKANIMKLSDGLFLECARKVAKGYPDIEYREMIIDNCAMQLVRRPQQFDVLLMENLYGDIVSDLCAGLVGGLGVVAGSNIGDDCAVFEAVHGSAPDIAGKRLANPAAVVLSMAEMVRHVGEDRIAHCVTRAVHAALADPATRTSDLGGSATRDQITQAIIDNLSWDEGAEPVPRPVFTAADRSGVTTRVDARTPPRTAARPRRCVARRRRPARGRRTAAEPRALDAQRCRDAARQHDASDEFSRVVDAGDGRRTRGERRVRVTAEVRGGRSDPLRQRERWLRRG